MEQLTSAPPLVRPGVLTRVCVVTEGFYPPAVGGQQLFAHHLAAALVERGHPVLVITRQTDPPAAPAEQVDGIKVIRVPPGGLLTGKGWAALAPLVLFLWRAFRLLLEWRNDYDVILVLGLKTLPLPALLAARLTGRRITVKPESPIELWQGISAKSLQAMGIGRFSPLMALVHSLHYALVRRADRLLAISAQIRQELIKSGVDPRKIVLVPNGIDTDVFRPVDGETKRVLRQRLGLPVQARVFVYTGRLTTSKGVMELAQAWDAIARERTDMHLALVGSGQGSFDDCEDELNAYVRQHGLAPSVTFAGAVDNVQEYLQAADAFVFPSRYEGFGLSIVEAMACELPCVVTRVGVALDVIQDYWNGILVTPDRADELQAAMAWLLEHPQQWGELGANARRDVVARYSMAAVTSAYAQTFAEVQKFGAIRRRVIKFGSRWRDDAPCTS